MAQQPCFSIVGDSVGCAPFTLRMRNCVPSATPGGIIYFFNTTPAPGSPGNPGFNGTNTFGAVDTIRYEQPGTYFVTQQISNTANRRSRKIIVLPRTTPTVSLIPCSNRRIKLSVTKAPGERFLIDYGDGNTIATSADDLNTPRTSFDTVYQYSSSIPVGTMVTVGVRGYYPCTTPATAQGRLLGATILLSDTLKVSITPRTGIMLLNYQVPIGYSPETYQYEASQILPNGSAVLLARQPGGQPQQLRYSLAQRLSQPRIRIVTKDVCGVTLATNEFVHTPLTVLPQNNQNTVSWVAQNHPLGQSYNLIRNQLSVFTSAGITSYVDRNVSCARRYCYQVITVINKTPGVMSSHVQLASNDTCITALANIAPGPVQDLLATVVNGRPELSWDRPLNYAVRDYEVLRSRYPDTANFSRITLTTDLNYRDEGMKMPPQQPCYRVVYRDSCGNRSQLAPQVCPISLVSEELKPGILLRYNAYAGMPAPFSYFLEYLDENGRVYRNVPLGRHDTLGIYSYPDRERHPEQQRLRYRIRVTNTALGLTTFSNVAEVVQRLRVLLPTAFSPNNDGINDLFMPVYAHIDKYDLRIYNRWGEPVFRSVIPTEGWDGRLSGQDAPSGVYLVVVTGTDEEGQTFDLRTTITLVR